MEGSCYFRDADVMPKNLDDSDWSALPPEVARRRQRLLPFRGSLVDVLEAVKQKVFLAELVAVSLS